MPPLLAKPKDGETLYLYPSVSTRAVSAVLVREEEKIQWPVYSISTTLLDTETRCPEIEKLSIALTLSARKLRPYFQAHQLVVKTKYPIKKALQKDTLTRMAVWSPELREYRVEFQPRTTIKGQDIANFIAEFTYDENL